MDIAKIKVYDLSNDDLSTVMQKILNDNDDCIFEVKVDGEKERYRFCKVNPNGKTNEEKKVIESIESLLKCTKRMKSA